MFIPLENLYTWIDSLTPDTLIYRFLPHGSRFLGDLNLLEPVDPNTDTSKHIPVICHDQEPLNYQRYQFDSNAVKKICVENWPDLPEYQVRSNGNHLYWEFLAQQNLGSVCLCVYTDSDRFVLLHSEKRSPEVELYQQNGFETAYWWSHGMIARDWYRYAQLDQRLPENHDRDFEHSFNIYCRAWSGTREYRLKFLELAQSVNSARITFDQYDSGQYYQQHQYYNTNFQLEQELMPRWDTVSADSSASATYDVDHYQRCAVDVVLETLFDDSRLHLTEKVLRPIACGKPFVLAATAGSLQYLRDYGFRTFDSIWDESYDSIKDPVERLSAIAETMRNIDQKKLWKHAQEICDHNRQHFFSEEFAGKLAQELIFNLYTACGTVHSEYQNREMINRIAEITSEEDLQLLLNS